ncbi:MAG: acetylornithine/succinylornithine family transaminase [Lachnospiraceae bacterium]|nr:acetylornithine/succinylornithine family transaminase [Lachnospiraceae bacterium]
MNYQQADEQYIAHTYKRFPIVITKGQGSLVEDENGKEYIDLGTGIAVNSFGVADPVWQEAVSVQIGKVQHMSNLYYTEPCIELAQMLCSRTGMKKVFFSNSGAEANECAIKVARKYAAAKKGADCFTIVTLENSFHGRTITTLAATGQAHYHEDFQPLTPGFIHVKPGDMAALEAAAKEHKLAAVMIECVQGEGGVLPLDKDYVLALSQFVKDHDLLLIVDEVQTGNGRTGELYAYMHYGLSPDIVSTAKGLAGGLPLGATLMNDKTQDVLSYGDHGSTFGGNPVSCAAGVSILSRIDDALLADVRKKSALIFDALKDAPGVEDVSGLGLMIGVKTTKPAAEVLAACMENGLLCLTAKDRIRLLPALNIPEDILMKGIGILKAACV